MIRPRRQRQRSLSEINVVPYIDVMLVLLVIFMITAPLLTQGVQVQLPQAQAESLAPKSEPPVIVSINSRGEFFLNTIKTPQAPLSAEALRTAITAALTDARAHKDTRQVYVKADKNVNYGEVMEAMVMLQQAGAEQVGLITSPSQAQHPY